MSWASFGGFGSGASLYAPLPMTSARRFAFAGATSCAAAHDAKIMSTTARKGSRTPRLYKISCFRVSLSMALLLKESDVERLLTMSNTIELVERVHREYSTGQAIDVPRERTRLPKAALQILQGAVPSANVLGYKAYTSSREG